MVATILVEVILLLLIWILGLAYWQIIKRHRFMRSFLKDEATLRRFVDNMIDKNLFKPDAKIAPTQAMWTDDYMMNIRVEMKTSQTALRRVQVVALIVMLFTMGISYYLGYQFLLINLVVFLLFSFLSLVESGKENALIDVMSIAWNLGMFYKERPVEFQQFTDTTTNIRPFSIIVKEEIDKRAG